MTAPHYGMPIPFMFVGDGSERTFELEETLPSLPVPPLDQTLAKYLESVKPHVTADEYKRTEDIVQKFASGVGKDLHTKLLSIAQHSRNWLFDWWEQFAYLSLRVPHAPYVNFGGPAPYSDTMWPAQEGTQCERGALVAWYMLQFWQLVHKELLPIDRGGKKTVWSMYQFYRMFNGCKTPGESIDTLNDYFKTEREGGCPTHLVVICKGRFFSFEAVDSHGHVITAPELEQYFIEIREECEREGEGLGVGALTAENRTEWYKLRNHLISLNPENEKHLETIQKCLFVIVLEDSSPSARDELFRESMVGEARNRWLDKACQLLVFKNGKIGSNCDHAPHDAMVNIVQSYFVYLALDSCGYQWKGPKEKRNLGKAKEIVFHVDDKITTAIPVARELFKKGGESLEIIVRKFTGFGKKFIRENNLHPDTFVQMALHYSYIRLHGKPAAGYETASTRKFYRGRTETLRSCTTEVVEWSHAMMDQKTTTRQRLQLLIAAMDKHNKLMAEGQENMGCDRHLFGLQIVSMIEGLPLPEIYTDPAYTLSGGGGNFILSTSCVGYTPVIGGVAPMCKNGYGFFYSIEQDDTVQVNTKIRLTSAQFNAIFLFSGATHREFFKPMINMAFLRWMEDKTSATELYRAVCDSFHDMKHLITNKEAKL